jgi:hypothetical protein
MAGGSSGGPGGWPLARGITDRQVAHLADWLAWQGRALVPDRAQAERFLAWLDPRAPGFWFRTFSESPVTRRPGRDPLERALYGTLEQCWEILVALNRAGAAVSVTLNASGPDGRAPEQIRRVRALVLDEDGPPGRSLVAGPVPHLSVCSSPGHHHRYWRVQGLPPAAYRTLQLALARQRGGDRRVCGVNQSMGLPGLWRRKPGRLPWRTELVAVRDRPPLTPAQVAVWLG